MVAVAGAWLGTRIVLVVAMVMAGLFGPMCMLAQTSGLDSVLQRLPPQVRMARAIGSSDETAPPVLLLQRDETTTSEHRVFGQPLGERTIHLEFDIQAAIPPAMYVQFVHCAADWTEDGNIFINDLTLNRTSNIDWAPAVVQSSYFSFRGRVTVPNEQVKFRHGGNWKAKFFLYDDNKLLCELRFFVVDPIARVSLNILNDIYKPRTQGSNCAHTLEAFVESSITVPGTQIHSAVFYRMNRWNEPMWVSDVVSDDQWISKFSYELIPNIAGFAGLAKRFRIFGVPCETEYRVLDMSNTAQYPRIGGPVRLPLADLRRSGEIQNRADDGAMVTRFISSGNDEYINVEFVLDPLGAEVDRDVFVVGSFNNWTPSREWQMFFDEDQRLWRARNWVRRARHGYYYGTGEFNVDTKVFERVDFEDFEGNNPGNPNPFLTLVYFRDIAAGGFDSIIAVAAGSVFGRFGR